MNHIARQAERRGFLLGTLFAAWHMHRGHGEDTYAEELLTQAAPLAAFMKLARDEDYQFQRGFWASCKRRMDTSERLAPTRSPESQEHT